MANVNTHKRKKGNDGEIEFEERHPVHHLLQRSEIIEIIRTEISSAIKNALSNEFAFMKEEILSFEQSIKFMNAEFEDMTAKFKECNEEVKSLRSENSCLLKRITDMEARIGQLEQDARQNNIEIHCLPEHKRENLVNTVMQLSNVVSYPLTENEILSCSRVQKLNASTSQPRAVICKLPSKIKRDNLLGAISLYNRSNPNNKLNTKLLGYGDKLSPVYVSEHLTKANKSLHAATRIAAKEKKYKFVWVRNGRVFVRKEEGSTVRTITSLECLKKLD
ncbi:uncharacterized protein LOC124645291 [Helicoverpa zea]|uniref:uncharacterized protein LOC124632595 n=1 Tax=Helicoverpa zea TaxID=7113 RepID=UPI001F575290|nr:uncharacterized protein LOC124632595 [Helicoverpa zea]XP_047041048.1 uncharacterized protein LOC124645291 [Helicoverpa zea]